MLGSFEGKSFRYSIGCVTVAGAYSGTYTHTFFFCFFVTLEMSHVVRRASIEPGRTRKHHNGPWTCLGFCKKMITIKFWRNTINWFCVFAVRNLISNFQILLKHQPPPMSNINLWFLSFLIENYVHDACKRPHDVRSIHWKVGNA